MLSVAKSRNYGWWVFAAMAVGTFTSVADNGGVIVALPSIADHFATDLPTTQWVVIGYILTISALLLPMGRLSDLMGRKKVYIAGYCIFVLGDALSAFSSSMLSLILSRMVQGCGAAMTQGTAMAMIVSAFPSSERGKALGLELGVVGAGGVVGPVLAGLLAGALDWRWVFLSTVLLGVVSTLVALMVLDSRRDSQSPRGSGFDWPGAALSTTALVTFLLAMTVGSRTGWASPWIAVAMLSFVGLLGGFAWREIRTAEPLMDLGLFRSRLFSLGILAGFISFLGMSSVRFLMPFYLQAVMGLTPIQVGLIIVPNALCMIILGPIRSGRLSDRYGWRRFTVAGMVLSATALFLLSTVTENTPLALIMAAMILQNIGGGTFYAPNNSSILSTVERGRYGTVSGFLNLVRNCSNVTGVALVTAVATATMASMGYAPSLAAVADAESAGVLHAFASGLRIAYLAMGFLALVGAAVSFARGGPASQALIRSAQARGETAADGGVD